MPLISNEFVDTRAAFLEKCQMYHWQFDELRNAQHSTLMLLYHLHGMHKAARARQAASNSAQADAQVPPAASLSTSRSPVQVRAACMPLCHPRLIESSTAKRGHRTVRPILLLSRPRPGPPR